LNPYESDKLLSEYLLFHYGNEEDIFAEVPGPREAVGFATRLVHELIDPLRIPAQANALEIGCAVGRSAFELTQYVSRVDALDYSHRFIEAANALKAHGSLDTHILVEGDLTTGFTATVPGGLQREAVTFFQGDATALPDTIVPADVVLAANLICRLPEPARFINRLPGLVKPGGQLLLTTPFTWMEDFTPKSHWIGGTNGQRSFDALQEVLAPHFELSLKQPLPLIIREHVRKFQYTVALGSRWIRRS